ncbi:MAG: radical SAM protein [Dehalococcoidales bacterium]|nr:radical SAM protein [Dehalococcoidales bacterium]
MEPGYIALYHSGELEHRARRLETRLASCDICPRECRVNRLNEETGFCHSGLLPIVSSFCAHHGEEPAISGSRGSGTIFFGNCNLRCVYCQNYQISQDWQKQRSNEVDYHTLAENMLYLQDEIGCHNINLVSPSHFVPQIVRALTEAVPMGLKLPLVYNTNGYDSVKTLEELSGIVSIYLPDLKYASDAYASQLSEAPDYVARSRQAIKEMYRQVGGLVTDKSGLAQQGLIVRHLILPNGLSGSRDSLTWLAKETSRRVAISAMSQYHPVHRADQFLLLSRSISPSEYQEVLDIMEELGLKKGWTQNMDAHEDYFPDFEREGHPFL